VLLFFKAFKSIIGELIFVIRLAEKTSGIVQSVTGKSEIIPSAMGSSKSLVMIDALFIATPLWL